MCPLCTGGREGGGLRELRRAGGRVRGDDGHERHAERGEEAHDLGTPGPRGSARGENLRWASRSVESRGEVVWMVGRGEASMTVMQPESASAVPCVVVISHGTRSHRTSITSCDPRPRSRAQHFHHKTCFRCRWPPRRLQRRREGRQGAHGEERVVAAVEIEQQQVAKELRRRPCARSLSSVTCHSPCKAGEEGPGSGQVIGRPGTAESGRAAADGGRALEGRAVVGWGWVADGGRTRCVRMRRFSLARARRGLV